MAPTIVIAIKPCSIIYATTSMAVFSAASNKVWTLDTCQKLDVDVFPHNAAVGNKGQTPRNIARMEQVTNAWYLL